MLTTEFLSQEDPLTQAQIEMAIAALPDVFCGEAVWLENLAEIKQYCEKDPSHGALRWLKEAYQQIAKDATYYPNDSQRWEWFAHRMIAHLDILMAKKQAVEPMEFANWEEIVRSFTGVYLLGDPGSGKTTTMLKFLGLCTQVLGPMQAVILDLHNEPGKWPEGTTVIESIAEARQFMEWLLQDELPRRIAAKKRGESVRPLLWLIDEIGRLRREFEIAAEDLEEEVELLRAEGIGLAKEEKAELYQRAATILKQAKRTRKLLGRFIDVAGSEGRKYELFGMAGNQVANTEGSGLKGLGDAMEAYTKIYLGRLAHKWAKILGLPQSERDWIKEQAYPCMADGMPALHLTHWGYSTRERGQVPLDPIPAQIIPVERLWKKRAAAINGQGHSAGSETSPAPVSIAIKQDQDLVDYRAILQLKESLGRSPLNKEIVMQVFGEESETYASSGGKYTREYKPRLDRIRERCGEW